MVIQFIFHANSEMRAVILKMYYLPIGLTSIIGLHKKIPPNLQRPGMLREDEDFVEKQRLSKMKKGYSQDLVKQTVDSSRLCQCHFKFKV